MPEPEQISEHLAESLVEAVLRLHGHTCRELPTWTLHTCKRRGEDPEKNPTMGNTDCREDKSVQGDQSAWLEDFVRTHDVTAAAF